MCPARLVSPRHGTTRALHWQAKVRRLLADGAKVDTADVRKSTMGTATGVRLLAGSPLLAPHRHRAALTLTLAPAQGLRRSYGPCASSICWSRRARARMPAMSLGASRCGMRRPAHAPTVFGSSSRRAMWMPTRDHKG